jgi:hypothetical protein
MALAVTVLELLCTVLLPVGFIARWRVADPLYYIGGEVYYNNLQNKYDNNDTRAQCRDRRNQNAMHAAILLLDLAILLGRLIEFATFLVVCATCYAIAMHSGALTKRCCTAVMLVQLLLCTTVYLHSCLPGNQYTCILLLLYVVTSCLSQAIRPALEQRECGDGLVGVPPLTRLSDLVDGDVIDVAHGGIVERLWSLARGSAWERGTFRQNSGTPLVYFRPGHWMLLNDETITRARAILLHRGETVLTLHWEAVGTASLLMEIEMLLLRIINHRGRTTVRQAVREWLHERFEISMIVRGGNVGARSSHPTQHGCHYWHDNKQQSTLCADAPWLRLRTIGKLYRIMPRLYTPHVWFGADQAALHLNAGRALFKTPADALRELINYSSGALFTVSNPSIASWSTRTRAVTVISIASTRGSTPEPRTIIMKLDSKVIHVSAGDSTWQHACCYANASIVRHALVTHQCLVINTVMACIRRWLNRRDIDPESPFYKIIWLLNYGASGAIAKSCELILPHGGALDRAFNTPFETVKMTTERSEIAQESLISTDFDYVHHQSAPPALRAISAWSRGLRTPCDGIAGLATSAECESFCEEFGTKPALFQHLLRTSILYNTIYGHLLVPHMRLARSGMIATVITHRRDESGVVVDTDHAFEMHALIQMLRPSSIPRIMDDWSTLLPHGSREGDAWSMFRNTVRDLDTFANTVRLYHIASSNMHVSSAF